MKLGLGTVQFGLNYGATNLVGILGDQEVRDILQRALDHNIEVIDTASSYGTSEAQLGKHLPVDSQFRLFTKTFTFCDDSQNLIRPMEELKNGFMTSLLKLKKKNIEGLFFHRGKDLLSVHGTSLWRAAQEIKNQGLVKMIGVSVYEPIEAIEILKKFSIDVIQIPLSVLDQRFLKDKILDKICAQKVEIHARSVFLQGLLLVEPETVSKTFSFLIPHLKKFHKISHNINTTPLLGALGFVAKMPQVQHIICGVTSQAELDQIINMCVQSQNFQDFSSYLELDGCEDHWIDPRYWPNESALMSLRPESV